jgi:glycosyltransferase involved in cell wall biosynthesis
MSAERNEDETATQARRVALGVVVNTYNQPEYLTRVLRGLATQSHAPDEVLVADDGSEDSTREVFKRWAQEQFFRCEHVWQEHRGFRRSSILNQAIARARSDYLIFLDGDTVPHPQFVSDHARLATRGSFVQGHRALIEQAAAKWFGLGDFSSDRRRAWRQWLLGGFKSAYRWPFPMKRRRSDLRGVRGCNLGIWRADLLRVNGYNEAFEGWGREDSELALRLMNAGTSRLDVRGWALCYHLWHPPASRDAVPRNDDLLEETQNRRLVTCERGLNQYLSS